MLAWSDFVLRTRHTEEETYRGGGDIQRRSDFVLRRRRHTEEEETYRGGGDMQRTRRYT